MKKFKITEEQIKENKDLILKEYFKEVFETKLEVGKWYKSIDNVKHIFCVKKTTEDRYYYYGINYVNKYKDYDWYSFNDVNLLNGYVLATEKEVFNALKKEAEKRGFVKGNKVKDNGLEFSCGQNEILKDNTFIFDLKGNGLWIKVVNNYNCLIFENGKWAEIISQP